MDVRAMVRPIVRWLINLFLSNLETVVEEVAAQLIAKLDNQSEMQKYLDMIENPLVRHTAAAMLQAIRAYLKDVNVKDVIDFTR